ncbi:hypothetical protein ACVW1A_003774 [Bradyrhizobium sp. LB1.3]
MRIDSKLIAGLPIKTARGLMRELHEPYRVNVEAVLDFLNDEHWRSTVDAACKNDLRIPRILRQQSDADDRKQYCKIWGFKFKPIKMAEAQHVFAQLLSEGYFEPHQPESDWDKAQYETSQKGRQLAAMNLTKRFDRAKADKEVAALIRRANEINRRDELVFFVSKISAFGSYVTDSDDLGDIDLVVETVPRRDNHTGESHYRANNSGKVLDWSSSLYYGQREVLQVLRARKSRLSFVYASTVERLNTKTRVLFEWHPGAERRAEMEAFDWRLHEPLRQVSEWLGSNPGINADPVEIARWCQDFAVMLSKPRSHPLFRDWGENTAHDLLSYWGVTASEAAAEKAHRMEWEEYRERVSCYITEYYERSVNTQIESEIYADFVRGSGEMDAAILIAKRARWNLIKVRSGWISPLQQRIGEIEGDETNDA